MSSRWDDIEAKAKQLFDSIAEELPPAVRYMYG
jgi:hypothetical protein